MLSAARSLSLSLPTKDPLSPITKANSGNCLKQTKAAATAAIVSVACSCCFCCCFGSWVAPTTWQLHKQLKLHTLCYTHLSIPLSPALHALYTYWSGMHVSAGIRHALARA